MLFVGSVLGVACGALGGCTELEPAIIQSSIRTTDPGLDPDIEHWLEGLSPEERAVVEKEIRRRKGLLIHVSEADLPADKSRGGASDLASSRFSKARCRQHPKVKGVPSTQDWDAFIDRRLAEKWAKKNGIRNPPDAILDHEIRGHILLMLRNPEYIELLIEKDKEAKKGATVEVREKAKEELRKLRAYLEEEGRKIENEYRRYNDLEEMPEYLPESTTHEKVHSPAGWQPYYLVAVDLGCTRPIACWVLQVQRVS
jgi:hypothetical protein